MAQQLTQAGRRQRRVLGYHQVHQRVHARFTGRAVIGRGPGITCGVDTHPAVAPRHAQQAAVVQAVEQFGAGIRRTAKPVAHLAMREIRVHLARVHGALRAHEFKHRLCLRPARLGPHGARYARMHQRLMLARHETVVDEEVFFDRQLRIAALQVTGAVTRDAVAQRQVLGARRRAKRVGLDEAQPGNRPRQRGRFEQAARDGITAQVVESDRHPCIMPHRYSAFRLTQIAFEASPGGRMLASRVSGENHAPKHCTRVGRTRAGLDPGPGRRPDRQRQAPAGTGLDRCGHLQRHGNAHGRHEPDVRARRAVRRRAPAPRTASAIPVPRRRGAGST